MSLPQRGFSFGPYQVDAVRRLVWMDGTLLPVTGKAFEILRFLIEHRDRVVDKDELLKSIWPDTFVQENNLVRHVSTLRRALGQKADQHDYVLTVQGRGYQFVALVTPLDSIAAGLPPVEEPAASAVAVPPESPSDIDALEVLKGHHENVRTSARGLVGVMTLLLVIAGIAVVIFWRWPAQGSSVAPSLVRQITYGPSSSLNPTWSPDGAAIAYASDRAGNFDLWVQRLDGSEAVHVTQSTAEEWQPAWSPDGLWLAYRSEQDGGGVFVVSLNGGMSRRVSDFGYEPRWAPDGTRLLFYDSIVARRPRRRLFSVSVNGGQPQEIRTTTPASPQATMAAAWTPQGDVAIWSADHGKWTFVTSSLDGQHSGTFKIADPVARQVQELGLEPMAFSWAADGHSLVFDGVSRGVHNIWRVSVDRVDPADGWVAGPLERLTTGSGGDRDIAMAATGTRVAYSSMSDRTRIVSFALDADGRISGPGVPVTEGGSGEFDAAVSDDAQRLVYRTTRDGRQELWERSLRDGRERRLLSGESDMRTSPRWSPDGTRLAYQLSAPQPREAGALVVLALNDLREQVLTAPGAASLVPDDWSRDGEMILGPCFNPKDAVFEACIAPAVASANVVSIAADPKRNLRSLRFSPDQHWISAVSFARDRAHDRSAVVVMPFGGGSVIEITHGTHYDQKPVWSRDGRTLYFVSNRDGFFNVWARRFDPLSGLPVGDPFRVTSFSSPRQMLAQDLSRLEITVAAQHLYIPVTERTSEILMLDAMKK